MKLVVVLVIVALIVSAWSIPAPGRGRKRANPKAVLGQMVIDLFAQADGNEDGKLENDEYWTIYSVVDRNRDGSITKREYIRFMVRLRALRRALSRRQVAGMAAKLFTMGDKTGDGVLTPADGRIIFDNMDKDGDGFVTKEEYMSRWAKLFKKN